MIALSVAKLKMFSPESEIFFSIKPKKKKTRKFGSKSRRFVLYLGGVFDKTIISLVLVAYEMIIANLALRPSLAIYHLISNARSWNNC